MMDDIISTIEEKDQREKDFYSRFMSNSNSSSGPLTGSDGETAFYLSQTVNDNPILTGKFSPTLPHTLSIVTDFSGENIKLPSMRQILMNPFIVERVHRSLLK